MKKRLFFTICLAALSAGVMFGIAPAEIPGLKGVVDSLNNRGTENNPYAIATARDFVTLSNFVNNVSNANHSCVNTYFQMLGKRNIDMASVSRFIPIGGSNYRMDDTYDEELDPEVLSFRGIFDGRGLAVSHLRIEMDDGAAGLFGLLGKGARIRNLGIINSTITGVSCTGGICGFAAYADIDNCHAVQVAVTGFDYIGDEYIIVGSGGICGYSEWTNFEDSYSSGCAVNGYLGVGGVCGVNEAGNFNNCYSAECVIRGANNCGGFVGLTVSGEYKYCYSTNTLQRLSAPLVDNEDFGGFCGSGIPVVHNVCYSVATWGNTSKITPSPDADFGGKISYLTSADMQNGTLFKSLSGNNKGIWKEYKYLKNYGYPMLEKRAERKPQ